MGDSVDHIFEEFFCKYENGTAAGVGEVTYRYAGGNEPWEKEKKYR